MEIPYGVQRPSEQRVPMLFQAPLGSDVFFPTDAAALSVDTQPPNDLLATDLPFPP
jgi:hypothetical protein